MICGKIATILIGTGFAAQRRFAVLSALRRSGWIEFGIGDEMKKALKLGWVMAGAILIANCDANDIDGPIGGPCDYVKYPGSAIIVSVEQDTDQMRTCENGALIKFTFRPTDSSASSRYLYPQRSDTNQAFLVGSGCSPPLNWALSRGLVVGSEHSCVRREIISGTCSPVGFGFPDIDYSAWGDSCEARTALSRRG